MKKRNYILSETEIAKDLAKLSPMVAMDQNAKYFLMHPDILSFILKHTLTEFAALDTAEIQKHIDGVNVQRPSRLKEILQNVQFLNPSDYIPGEGQIIYDLLLSLRIPGEKEGDEDISDSNELYSMLSALFSKTMKLDERKKRLEECGIPMTEYVERRMDTMWRLADRYIDFGRTEGRAEGRAEGRQETIDLFLETCSGYGVPYEVAIARLEDGYNLSSDEAVTRAERYYRKSDVHA